MPASCEMAISITVSDAALCSHSPQKTSLPNERIVGWISVLSSFVACKICACFVTVLFDWNRYSFYLFFCLLLLKIKDLFNTSPGKCVCSAFCSRYYVSRSAFIRFIAAMLLGRAVAYLYMFLPRNQCLTHLAPGRPSPPALLPYHKTPDHPVAVG